MKNKATSPRELPTVEQLTAELSREKYKKRYKRVLRSTIYTLITVAAIAVLVAMLWLPVLQIYGNSMTPTLVDGEIIFTVKTSDFEPGDIISFYYNNKILVKRVIARDRVKFFREKSSAGIEWPEFGASFEQDSSTGKLAAGQTCRRMLVLYPRIILH